MSARRGAIRGAREPDTLSERGSLTLFFSELVTLGRLTSVQSVGQGGGVTDSFLKSTYSVVVIVSTHK